MTKQFIFLLLLNIFYSAKSQSFSDFVRNQAIDLNSDALVDSLKQYKCILIGEMHGTSEMAVFLEKIAQKIAQKGQKVLIGLEIPQQDMTLFLKNPTLKNLKNSYFFKQGYDDGRNNAAWFDLISKCRKKRAIRFCFFDADSKIDAVKRDSLMFVHLLESYQKDTSQLIIALSGNIHNRIKPFRNNKTMGCHLVEYFTTDKVLSINHFYGKGQAHNRISKGLAIHELQGQGDFWGNKTSFKDYFLLKLPVGFLDDYTSIIYTQKLTASLPVFFK